MTEVERIPFQDTWVTPACNLYLYLDRRLCGQPAEWIWSQPGYPKSLRCALHVPRLHLMKRTLWRRVAA